MSVPLQLLPSASHARGKRSLVTCRLKCGDACLGPECNQSANPTFRSIADAVLSRRSALGLGVAGALAIAVAPALGGPRGAAAAAAGSSTMPFEPIAPVPVSVDAMTVPTGYRWVPVIRWGDPVLPGAPVFDAEAQTAEAQARQFGYNNDYTDVIPDASGLTGVLVANHEYCNEQLMFPPTTDPDRLAEQSRIMKMAQGMSVVEVERDAVGSPWRPVIGPRSRRVTVETELELTGPAAGGALLRTASDPSGRVVLGTLGNCAGGTTPWGTVLSGEENFNSYFRTPTATPATARYGLADRPTSTRWELEDPRFLGTDGHENEPNRFGYIVEIDPQDPTAPAMKHTAMGRFKHEGANVRIGEDGRVVAYMGDDERGDYLYKFVSKHRFNPGSGPGARKQNKKLLTEGDLFVARFTGDSPAGEIDGSGALPSDGAFDGVGQWVPLTLGGRSMVPGMTIEEVLVHTRLAADRVNPTKMDRPEDVEPHPTTGRVYVALTNNSNRGTRHALDEANPRTANRDGHVIELTETQGASGTAFAWSILLLCGDPSSPATYFAGYPKELVSPISCPDNVAFDSEGNLWISTDGQPGTLGLNDGLFKVALEGAERGRVEQFLAVPRDAETCGPIIHDRERTVFVAVQHPGEDGTWGAQRSLFPDYGATGPGTFAGPRPSVVQVLPA
ncbi:PhoX family phosphatase [Agrococcus sp. HG114]|uniref:PhoX family protein n=1 Tax=Agrococcus sp. HG114 TaxID=2969757 RepID=UPI00215B6613|nr:PhoX family phosphatase [Agrococcus sp. HG114]MCR8671068.1 PhoX family phosphatase [Agrococcus sp. HG114]